MPNVAESRPYTPFSTAKNKRRAVSKPGNSPRRSNGPARSSLVTPTKPKQEMGLFGPIEHENLSKNTPRTKGPLPIPDVERDEEVNALLRNGIGLTEALELIANNWTLDQLVCLVLRANDETDHEADPLPICVRDVLPIVKSYCASRWPKKSPQPKKHGGSSWL